MLGRIELARRGEVVMVILRFELGWRVDGESMVKYASNLMKVEQRDRNISRDILNQPGRILLR